jgi:hypothetical protein
MFIVGILPRIQWQWWPFCSSLTNKSVVATKRFPSALMRRKRRSYKGKAQNPSPETATRDLTKFLTDQYL